MFENYNFPFVFEIINYNLQLLYFLNSCVAKVNSFLSIVAKYSDAFYFYTVLSDSLSLYIMKLQYKAIFSKQLNSVLMCPTNCPTCDNIDIEIKI